MGSKDKCEHYTRESGGFRMELETGFALFTPKFSPPYCWCGAARPEDQSAVEELKTVLRKASAAFDEECIGDVWTYEARAALSWFRERMEKEMANWMGLDLLWRDFIAALDRLCGKDKS